MTSNSRPPVVQTEIRTRINPRMRDSTVNRDPIVADLQRRITELEQQVRSREANTRPAVVGLRDSAEYNSSLAVSNFLQKNV